MLLPPAYVVRRGVTFSLCPPFVGGEGYPIQPWTGGGAGVPDPALDKGGTRSSLGRGGQGYPIQPWTRGVPNPALDGGGRTWSSLGQGESRSSLGQGGTPTLDGGVPHLRVGTPSPGTPPGIASTRYGYAAGGVPLAFTQEDFLVCTVVLPFDNPAQDAIFWNFTKCYGILRAYSHWASAAAAASRWVKLNFNCTIHTRSVSGSGIDSIKKSNGHFKISSVIASDATDAQYEQALKKNSVGLVMGGTGVQKWY